MHILHVESSPRKQRSASREVAGSFLEAWRGRDPGMTVDILDVWSTPLPEFDGPALEAKYAGVDGRARTAEQDSAWQQIQALAERFSRADLIVFSVPMWNYGIPYRLKHLIDAVSQKDVLFTFDGRQTSGLLDGRAAVVITARGSNFGEEFNTQDHDFQQRYLAVWLRMVGITGIHTVTVEKTFHGPEIDGASRTRARQEAAALAVRLLATAGQEATCALIA